LVKWAFRCLLGLAQRSRDTTRPTRWTKNGCERGLISSLGIYSRQLWKAQVLAVAIRHAMIANVQ
jgi:hypothetical protein